MAGKVTDRKGKSKEMKPITNDLEDNLAAFTLPDSLPCSEIDFPILVKKNNKANWAEILEESDKNMKDIEEYTASRKESLVKPPFLKTECDYIKDKIFVNLIPALEETLFKAELWDAVKNQKCFFNGIDHIVQVLWNNNPRHPERKLDNLHLFNMPWVRDQLLKTPRPFYPKSWLWTEEYAATLIQKTIRQYFVQRDDEVQEMRQFWKKLNIEQDRPEIDTNPYLAKKFASQQKINKM